MTGVIDVSVIIPCRNEAFAVQACIIDAYKAIKEMALTGEVIVVDNGSTDGTPLIALKAGAKVVSCTKLGYGSAIRAGIEKSTGRFVALGDGDGSYSFLELKPIIEELLLGADIVNGNRFTMDSPHPGAMPWLHRRIGNPLLTKVVNLFFSSNLSDVHCGLRGFDKAIYEKIIPSTHGFEACSEMMIRAVKNQLTIREVDVTLRATHPERQSKLRSFRDGLRHLILAVLYIRSDNVSPKFIKLFDSI